MESDEFETHLLSIRVDEENRDLPEEFDPFDLLAASKEELSQAEHALGVQFPEKYTKFMRRHGGGQFLYLELFPIVPFGEAKDDLITVNRKEFPKQEFIAIAPVGTGDFWGFRVVDKERYSGVGYQPSR